MNEEKKTLGKIIHNKRKELKLGLVALSEKCGTNCVSIIDYEKGYRLPSVITLNKLCVALDLDYDAMYDLLEKEKKERTN